MRPVHAQLGSGLELFLFVSTVAFARRAAEAGVTSLVIDWRNQTKHARLKSGETEMGRHTVAQLEEVVKSVAIPVTVRINGLPGGEAEMETALDYGARILMLPMARSAREVEKFVKRVRGRAKTIVQIETPELVADCANLRSVPWDYAFIGLKDLMISRGKNWLWEPLHDGTLDAVCGHLAGRQIGFGGITVIGGGQPLRFTDLMREYGRLGCTFSFLRRTFQTEIGDRDLGAELRALQAAWTATSQRGPIAVQQDQLNFRALIDLLRPETPGRPLAAVG
ncbi:MAG: aldolase/citrate lyase family protein [Opitutaceae bacterium]